MNTTHYEFCTIDASLRTDDPHDWYWDKVTHIAIIPNTDSMANNCLNPLLGVSWRSTHFLDHDPHNDDIIVYERVTEKPVAAFFLTTIH